MANEPWNEVAYRFFSNMLTGGSNGTSPPSSFNPSPVTTTTNVPTYASSTRGLAATADGIIFTVQGSASKLVKIRRVVVSGYFSTAAVGSVSFGRVTSLTGGTGTSAGSAVGLDSTNVASTTTSRQRWTVPPTGTTQYVSSQKYFAATVTTQVGAIVYTFGANDQPLILRDATEWFHVFLTGFAAYAGASFDVAVEWSEE